MEKYKLYLNNMMDLMVFFYCLKNETYRTLSLTDIVWPEWAEESYIFTVL